VDALQVSAGRLREVTAEYDHAGNAEKLGFPDAIHYERLDTRGPGEKGGINPRDDAARLEEGENPSESE
jgi:hypothetical protein